MRMEMTFDHIGIDTAYHCVVCGHHHCIKCKKCHRCGCDVYVKSRSKAKKARRGKQ